ncbi:MAG: HEAT repeat domain-containing protein, partial [Halobacteriota archaeon]
MRIFDSKPDIAKMLANGDVENLARIVENGGPYFDHDERTRMEAVDALGSLADQSAIDPLIGALHDEDERVRLSAVAALKKHQAFYPLANALRV